MKTIKWIAVAAIVALAVGASTNKTRAQEGTSSEARYSVFVLPPDGGPDSFLAGYIIYAPLTNSGTLGVAADMSSGPGFNSYSWTAGKLTNFQALPQRPDLAGTATYINWINQWGEAGGYGTRADPSTGASFDNAAIWLNGRIFPLPTPAGGQSRAVWINDFGMASGWISKNSTVDPCSFGVGLQSEGVVWFFGFPIPLGTLGGTDSYGEFINDLGQVSGHSETSNVPNAASGCPPFDPFIWQNGKMTDINPGNFGGASGGTNFLNNHGQAVGFGTVAGETATHPFLWSHGKLIDLYNVGNLQGAGNSAINVNELGHVVGADTNAEGALLGVLWRDGAFTNLMSLSAEGDDCSEAFRINSRDQIVGISFSCETGVEHAFLWENGEMQDLNNLIPSGLGLELESADWINDNGVIAAQAVLTAGPNAGASRAVLLIPTPNWSNAAHTAVTAAPKIATGAANPSDSASMVLKRKALLYTADGRLNPMLFRPFDPKKLVSAAQKREKQ